jgi:hypothetical protein
MMPIVSWFTNAIVWIKVWPPGIGQGIMGGLKQIVGGNIEANCKVGVWSIFRPTRADQLHNRQPKTWT